MTAQFSDVRGLVAGAQVRLAGIPVGQVTRVWLGADGLPRVSMSVDQAVSLRASARAAVRLASLSGEFNRYVSIIQGSGAPLPDGALIPLARTTSPVEVDEAASAFDPRTRGELARVLLGLRQTLHGNGAALATALRLSRDSLAQVAALAGDVGDDGISLGRLLTYTHLIAGTLAAHTPALARTVDQATGVLTELRDRSADVSAALAPAPAGLDAAAGALQRAEELIAPARTLLRAATPGVDELPAVAGSARAAIRSARPALDQARTLLTRLPLASRSLTALLSRARPLLTVLAPVLKRLGPMLDQLRVRLPDAFSFFANWADFTANFDAAGHGARVGIVVPPAPTQTLSPDSSGAGQLKPPYLRTPGALGGEPWRNYAQSFVGGRG